VTTARSHLVRQLKLFAWFLLLVNLLMVAIGLVAGRHLDQWSDAVVVLVAVSVLVNGAFVVVVGGNLLVMGLLALARRLRGRRC
jgi:hypothetical protein